MVARFRYSPWDGTQAGFDMDSLWIVDQAADDLLYNGDIQAALRRLMQDGLRDRDGNQLTGLREMLERLRAQREEMLASNQVGSVIEGLSERLDDILRREREYMDRQQRVADESGDADWARQAADVFEPRRAHLDLLPPDLGGQIRELNDYTFSDPDAGREFAEMVDELRQQLMGQTFGEMADAMRNVDPQQMARMKDMLAALNDMLARRLAGEEPDFDGFMNRFGDMFPENPRNLDELLEVLARRMAAMSALMNSMSPEQRAELAALSDQLMDDVDLRWQMDQLGAGLRQLFPEMGWAQRYDMSGQNIDPLDLAGAAELMGQLGELDDLEQILRSAASPGALSELDLDRVRELLGDDAANALKQLAEMQKQLEDDGLIRQGDAGFEMSATGMRRLGEQALHHVFESLDPALLGGHERPREGFGHERAYATRPFEFGDSFQLNVERTVRNALMRNAEAGDGLAVRLAPEDFEVEITEQSLRCATVLMLDLSLSMDLRGYFQEAKRTAVALDHLIRTRFQRDYIGLVAFARRAWEIRPGDLPRQSVEQGYGTNMEQGFELARRMLARQNGTKQIVMITDGEPTAHRNPDGGIPIFQYPTSPATEAATMREVARCTAANIRINTFMLEPSPGLQAFVDRMAKVNRGRVFYATPGNLGGFVLKDFLTHRRAMLRQRGG